MDLLVAEWRLSREMLALETGGEFDQYGSDTGMSVKVLLYCM